ncbi:T9SS type A sorting domain-containing protein [Spirosoma jeollabukense]
MAKLSLSIWLFLSSLFAMAQGIEQSRLLASGYRPQPLEQAGAILTATNEVLTNTSIEYKAGQAVVLQPGFEAKAGSVFTATVNPKISFPSESDAIGLSIEAYPNPFVDQTTIKYTVPIKGQVQHTLLNAKGQPVPQVSEPMEQTAGSYQTQLEGHDLPVGVYLYQLQVGGQTRTLRLIKK